MSLGVQNTIVRNTEKIFFIICICYLCSLTPEPGYVISSHTDISVISTLVPRLPRAPRQVTGAFITTPDFVHCP